MRSDKLLPWAYTKEGAIALLYFSLHMLGGHEEFKKRHGKTFQEALNEIHA